ncbi:MAG: hypothetical protein R2706_07790 [Acidimicrobiales bacterium]
MELGKLLTALNYTTYAIRPFNDFYVASLGGRRASNRSLAMWVTKLGILTQDVLCRCGLLGYGLGSIVSFKEEPSATVIDALKTAGFRIVDLPRNPYLPSDSAV